MHPSAAELLVEYLPTPHWVHELAPTMAFVMDPGPHALHAATLDDSLYRPAVHYVQFLAPVAAPVSVIEPAGHKGQ
jgi:hypothetical protein